MAGVLRNKGKYEEAMKVYQKVYDKRKEILGEDHPGTINSKYNMALILQNQGKYEEAMKAYLEVYEKRKEILGEDHSDTLSGCIAMAMGALEQYPTDSEFIPKLEETPLLLPYCFSGRDPDKLSVLPLY